LARAPRLLAASVLACSAPLLGGCVSMPIHNVNVLGGSRMLDETDWEPVDRQLVVGLDVDTYKPRSGIGAEMGFQYATDSGSTDIPSQGPADIDGENIELYAGARKTFPLFNDRFYPYLSLGITWIDSTFDLSLPNGSTSDGGDSFGVYIRGGFYWNFAGNWHVGLDLRRVIGTEIDILGVSTDADYFQPAVFLGFAF
jgi:hypothetical protein